MKTHEEFADLGGYDITDAHIHLWDPALVDEVPPLMREAGISRWNVACTPAGHLNSNPSGFLLKHRYPRQTYLFATFDLGARLPGLDPSLIVPAGEQIDRLVELGAQGIKMLEGKPTVYKELDVDFQSRLYGEFFSRMEERRLPVLWHVADPEEFWDTDRVPQWAVKQNWAYTDGSFPAKESLYREVDKVLAAHPDLTVIFAHFYFISADLERAARFLDENPSVFLDLTPGVEMYHNFTRTLDESRRFFQRFQDRIIFGTDTLDDFISDRAWGRGRIKMVRRWLETRDVFPVPPDPLMTPDDRPRLAGIGLPPEVLEKIYRGNFDRIVGEPDESYSLELFRGETDRLGRMAESCGNERVAAAAVTVLKGLT